MTGANVTMAGANVTMAGANVTMTGANVTMASATVTMVRANAPVVLPDVDVGVDNVVVAVDNVDGRLHRTSRGRGGRANSYKCCRISDVTVGGVAARVPKARPERWRLIAEVHPHPFRPVVGGSF